MVTLAATWDSWRSLSRTPLGVPLVPLVHRKIPPSGGVGTGPVGRCAAPGPGGVSTRSPGGSPELSGATIGLGPGDVQRRGQRDLGGGRVERDHHPARAGDGDQGAGVVDRIRQPDGHSLTGRDVRVVQAPGPGAAGPLQAGEGELPGSPGVLKIGGAAPVRCGRVNPLLDQGHVPFFW